MYQHRFFQPHHHLLIMQIKEHNALYNKDKAAFACKKQESKNAVVDIKEMIHLMGNKHKDTSAPAE